MNDVLRDYESLLEQFINDAITLDELRKLYLTRFKKEARPMDEPVYEVLQALFGDIDLCTAAPELLSKHADYYLDEETLRQQIRQGLKRLSELLQR
ncbi:MAG: colicin immunity domain-containing protein [Zoogloeaceae bacterium]|jgi:hypothetical protein|nr:colicin immunity domain-containing protein [Zoogloeaceae bacterium]